MGRIAAAIVMLAVGALAAAARPAVAALGVQARLERSRIAEGESTTLEVVVSGAGDLGDPELHIPAGLDVLGRERSESHSWVNGRSLVQTVFRYVIGSGPPGSYTLGPVRVHAGDGVYQSAPLALEVVASRPSIAGGDPRRGGARADLASLEAEVTPPSPRVGQPVILRVRLILDLHQKLAEIPTYEPPSTTGFWAERTAQPETFEARRGNRDVQVTETRTRLYPLSVGVATIGPATAGLTLEGGGSFDASQRRIGGRRVRLRSDPVQVRVRPLPAGAPPGFDGAVGSFELVWDADRASTSQDVALTVRLVVRGAGNLPMVHTPSLSCGDCEVFSGSVDDSLGAPGSDSPSRREFRWTVLPRRPGPLQIPAPAFSWFDPAAAAYRRAQLAPVVIDVTPPAGPGGAERQAFPTVFGEHPVDPLARPARAWAWALAGLLLGACAALWREGGRRPADAADRARAREWLRAARHSGPEFWRAAEEASQWLEARGRPVGDLRRDIAAARYAAGFANPEPFRGRLTAELGAAVRGPRRALPLRALAVLAALGGVARAAASAPRWGPARAALDSHAGDQSARAGDIEGARRAWRTLWDSGSRAPGLAARLAWAELRAGSTGEAALWTLRGARGEPRDPALRWVWERVRESGGLTGASAVSLPVRTNEWAAAALLFGTLAGFLWPRTRRVAAVAALALACAAVGPVEHWRASRRAEAVVRSGVALEGAGLELAPGQVVRVRGRAADRLRVSAGREIAGWVPRTAVAEVD